MATIHTETQAELLATLSSIVKSVGGTSSLPNDQTVEGTVTAIKSQWLLGGRKVTSNFRCTLTPDTHDVHFRESAIESSWGLPPPSLSVSTTTQYGSRVKETRTDMGVGGGGKLEYGRFREAVEHATNVARWRFVYDVV